MRVQITAVWPRYWPNKTLKLASVIARDVSGKKHLFITFDPFMASLCLRYEKRSSTLDQQPPAVDLTVDDRGKILALQEAAA